MEVDWRNVNDVIDEIEVPLDKVAEKGAIMIVTGKQSRT